MDPEAPLPQTPPEEHLPQIRTFQGDVTNALKSQNESLLSIRTAENARSAIQNSDESRATSEQNNTPRSRTLLFFIGGMVLLISAGTAGWFSYQRYIEKTTVPVTVVRDNRFLSVATTKDINTINLTRETLVSLLLQERATPLADGNIQQIELLRGENEGATLQKTTEFLITIEAAPPGKLVRALNQLFMLAVLGQPARGEEASQNETFLIFKLESFENAYAGMLEWEPLVKDNLLSLFGNSNTEEGVVENEFKDITINNKDARILRDTSGKSMLIYSFYNQNLLIITRNEEALKTIITKLDTRALSR